MLVDAERKLRILDFDCEARPDAYLGGDITTRSLTAMAAAWVDEPGDVWCKAMYAGGKPHMLQLQEMLGEFRELYDQADIVTGHNIMKYDLPVVSGSMVYAGLRPLSPKLASDTYMHGPKAAMTFSRSLENVADMLGLLSGKHHMNNAAWKRSNTLDPDAVEVTKERVSSDVTLHIEVRAAMLERRMLKTPTFWYP